MFCCGHNRAGELGIGTFESEYSPIHIEDINEPINSISCGNNHTVAITSKGRIWVMGSNTDGQLGIGERYDDQCSPVFLKELNFAEIVKVRAGSFNAALSSENQLYVWGRNKFGNFYTPHRVKFFENYCIRDF